MRRVAIFVGLCASFGAVTAGAQDAPAAGPLRLRDAVVEALRHSPDLAPLEDAVARAELEERRAEAPFGVRWTPNLTSGSNPGGYNSRVLGMTVSKRLPTGGDVYVSGLSEDFGLGSSGYRDMGYSAGFTQPLATLFSSAATTAVTTARQAVTNGHRREADGRQQVVLSVAEAYFAVVRSDRLVVAAERALDRATLLHRASQARAAAGLDTQLDVARAELLASQAEIALGDAREGLAAADEQLNLTIGRPLDAPVVVDAATLPSVDGAPLDGRDPATVAIASRADLQERRARVDSLRRAAELARTNLVPPISLNVEYAQRGLGSPFEALLRPYNGWHIGLTSSYQLDRTERSVAAATADLDVRAAQRDVDTAEQRAIAEARKAERAVARADVAAAVQQRAVEIAARQQRLAQLRYERGLADNVALIEAENAVTQAEVASIAADLERRLARLRLRRAAGSLGVEDLDR